MEARKITRRECIKTFTKMTAGVALTGALPLSFRYASSAWAASSPERFIVEGIGNSEKYSVKLLVKEVFDAAGGIGRFILRGDVVVIKPNISWARAPHLAATTNPEVLQSVIELCQDAGAKKVRIADNTIHDVRRCFTVTGAGTVAKRTGADLVYPRSSLMRDMRINGHRLDVWPVFVPLVEADKVINLPIAKDHGLSGLTLGIKSWIGGVGGRRGALHQDIHQTIVDLAQFFNPTLTLIDAIRIMKKNGPSGGSPSDVAVKNTLILSDDPIAADAKAAMLFGIKPMDLGFIRFGEKWGLGTHDVGRLNQKRVSL
jgi:uncharacterized protein (DUF362 family)